MWQCDQLVVVGAGNMGAAIVQGMLRGRVILPTHIVAVDPNEQQRDMMQSQAVLAVSHVREVPTCRGTRAVLLAIKPQKLDAFASEWRGAASSARCDVVISVLAGVPRARIQAMLGEHIPCIRAMPNLPAMLGAGATAVCDDGVQSELQAFASLMFRAIGPCVIRLDESLLDAFTAVAGSGPAYAFLLAEAMIAGARDVGLREEDAREAVAQTLVGAAAMLASPGADAAQLRMRVTSPAGTTAAALRVLEERGVIQHVRDAIVAARDRGQELGKMM